MTPAPDDGAWVGDDGRTYRAARLNGFSDTLKNRTKLLAALATKRPGAWQLVALAEDGTAVVVDGQPPRRWGAITHRLAQDVRPSQASEIAGHLAQSGETLISFQPHGERVAVGQVFTPVETDLRARLCAVIKCEEWELGDTTVRFDDGGLSELTLWSPPSVSSTSETRTTRWLDVARAVIGHEGWRASVEQSGVVRLRAGRRVELPDRSGFDWNAIKSASVDRFPFATGGHGEVLSWALSDSPHVMVSGPTGSGKTVLLDCLLFDALAHGFDLAVVDPTKDGLDFMPYKAFSRWWGCESFEQAADTMAAVYEESQRRKSLLLSLGGAVQKGADLTDKQREEIGFGRPILVLLDEFTSMVVQGSAAKGLPADHPVAVQAKQLQTSKALLLHWTTKLAREARFVQVHLCVASQRFDTKLIDGLGELRNNLQMRVQLGRVNADSLAMGVLNREAAVPAFEAAWGAGPQAGGDESTPTSRRGRGLAEVEGVGTLPLQAWFAPMDEQLAHLAEWGVLTHAERVAVDPSPATSTPLPAAPAPKTVSPDLARFLGGSTADLPEFTMAEGDWSNDETE